MLRAFHRCPAQGGFSNERQGAHDWKLESREKMNSVDLMAYLRTKYLANFHRAQGEAADRESVATMDYRMAMSTPFLTEELDVRNGRLKETRLLSCSRSGSYVCYLDAMGCLGWYRLF
jgi:hypothetical protein